MLLVLTIAVIALAVMVVAEFALLLGLAREVGRLQMRLGPIGARETESGPPTSTEAPVVAAMDQVGREITIGGPSPGRDTLLMFVGPTCPICETLVPGLQALAKSESGTLRVLLVSDGEEHEHAAFLEKTRLNGNLPYIVSPTAGMQYRVGVTPYGVLLDEHGIVRAKGMCNHMHHVESLLNARQLEVPSLQHVETVNDLLEADQASKRRAR